MNTHCEQRTEQNPDLLNMLKVTGTKTVAEASNNHTCGTGVPLRDTRALNKSNWHSNGWLSDMPHTKGTVCKYV